MTKEEFISQVVHAFYQKAQHDILIGYHFARIKDFSTHMPRIVAFWENQLLGVPRKFEPPLDLINAHRPLRIHRGEVGRWMKLFKETLAEHADHVELKQEWLEKLSFFEQVFLKHPQLFAFSD